MELRKWLILGMALLGGCPAWCSPSTVEVHSNPAACLDVRTSQAAFEILPSGYVRALLKSSGRSVTLDEPASEGGAAVAVNGRTIENFRLDCAHAITGDATGKLGAAGRRIQIRAKGDSFPALQETIIFEVYDDFPTVLLETVDWRN